MTFYIGGSFMMSFSIRFSFLFFFLGLHVK